MKPARAALALIVVAATILGFYVCMYQGAVVAGLAILFLGSGAAAVAWPWGEEA